MGSSDNVGRRFQPTEKADHQALGRLLVMQEWWVIPALLYNLEQEAISDLRDDRGQSEDSVLKIRAIEGFRNLIRAIAAQVQGDSFDDPFRGYA